MPDRTARVSRICWTDLVLLLPMLMLLPFSVGIMLAALKSGVACHAGDTMNCTYAAAPREQLWYHIKGVVFGASGLLGGMAVTLAAVMSTPDLQRRRGLSRLLAAGLLLGSVVALWMLWTRLSRDATGLGAMVFVMSFTVLPVLVAARHLPRVLRAALSGPAIPPIPPVSHVQ